MLRENFSSQSRKNIVQRFFFLFSCLRTCPGKGEEGRRREGKGVEGRVELWARDKALCCIYGVRKVDEAGTRCLSKRCLAVLLLWSFTPKLGMAACVGTHFTPACRSMGWSVC